MNCLECQELLQTRLDGEPIAATEAFEQHLNQCATCREQNAAALRLLEGLKELPRPKPAHGFAQALTGKVLQDRRQRRDRLRRRVFLTTALAASVMTMLLLAYYWLPPRDPDTNKLVKEVSKKVVPPKKAPQPEHHANVPTPRNPLSKLTERWADATRDHAKVVLVATSLDGVEHLPAVGNLTAIEPSVSEASQEVTEGVRSVTRNARKAFDFFARELPMPDLEKN